MNSTSVTTPLAKGAPRPDLFRMKGANGPLLAQAGPGPKRDEETVVEERTKPVVPRRYKVIFHNDDYTTMEFVVECLMRFFRKSETEATHIMLTVHRSGAAVAGVFT